jgi:hypothetical protein
VPKVYRPRVEPDRPTRARLAGASAASELAVERALDWLARHQDADGRWNAAVARYDDGTAVPGDRDFTAHCPPDEVCSGDCIYWEADTALTGLALLAYLGAGYTHLDGRYTETVGKGISFLLRQQKPDGDLRGPSVVVGMYCHAMAALALCEAYALTGDPRLRDPAARAVAFLVRSRARDRQAWRYQPGERIGDTSILGWVVMGVKSAKEGGLPIPDDASVRRGVLAWLDRVSLGQSGGLACYQPGVDATPTMTAEAWVCRQFLEVGGPGPASAEAAESLLRNPPDRGKTNFYYWYYATLALYQHGGEPWTRWNAALRDRIVGLQNTSGVYDLRLMSSVNEIRAIPTKGKNLIVVAPVGQVLHFRIFGGKGNRVVDTDEGRLTEQARQIADLRKQLEGLWPPHDLTSFEKLRVIHAVTSIVGHTPSGHRDGSWDPDESLYGAKGGRIYCTALATLTLEVYYRYLRLYDEPKLPLEAGEAPRLVPPLREPDAPALDPEHR